LETNVLADIEKSIEKNTVRQLKRFLSYEKNVKLCNLSSGFAIQLSKIVIDEDAYSSDERAAALELVFCELMNTQWNVLENEKANDVFYPKTPTKLDLYLKITDSRRPIEERATHLMVLKEVSKKHVLWFKEISSYRTGEQSDKMDETYQKTLLEVMDKIREIHPEFHEVGEFVEISSLNSMQEEHERVLGQCEADIEYAEDRAERAHARLKKVEEERTSLSRQLNTERENGGKLRQERSERIAAQRKLKELQRAFELLQTEHVKTERRLRDMAAVLVKKESDRTTVWDLSDIKAMTPEKLLGVESVDFTRENLAACRRRFANVVHPDRARGLPDWTEALFAELMKLVNEASEVTQKNKSNT
jgi:hypothetical protein